ncbi:MAG: hypothetical protein H7240_13060 [Glaciimonas sp.]|nr:hypothetical protein [Glaciimonas sp.]
MIALLLLTLAGCATWKRPYKGESDFYRDKLSCERQAVQIYLTVIVNQLNPGYQSPANTVCRKIVEGNDIRTICDAMRDVFMPPSYSQNDVNAS